MTNTSPKTNKSKSPDTARRLLPYLKGSRRYLIPSALLALVGTLAELVIPLLTGRAIDCIVGRNNVDFHTLAWYVIAIALLVLVAVCCLYLSSVAQNIAIARLIKRLRVEGFLKLSRVPVKFIDRTSHGDIVARMVSDVEQVGDGLRQLLEQLFSGIVLCLGSLVLVFTVSWKVGLCLIALSPLYVIIARFISKGSAKLYARQQNIAGQMSGTCEECIGSLETVRALSIEEEARERFANDNARLQNVGWKAHFYSALVNPTTRLIVNSSYVLVGTLGSIALIGGTTALSVGLIASMLTYANQFAKPINELSAAATQMQSALASAARLFELFDAREEKESGEDTLACPSGIVAMRDVSFGYTKDRLLIENLNLDIPEDATVAIVGPTGAGKTTLVNLLMRFYDISGGSICIDNQDINDCTRESVRDCFAMVLQETWIFAGTVRENIAFGKEDATDEEVVAAAKKAHAHSFIKRLPQGYDTVLSEGGGGLSQGERQLLTIARAMMVDSNMLILDEATSSVDTMTEVRIQKAFREMMKGRTSFVIAHRLSTIRNADIILVMEDGDVVEQGNHEQLMAKGGLYSRLVMSS